MRPCRSLHLPGASPGIKGADKAREKVSGCLLKAGQQAAQMPLLELRKVFTFLNEKKNGKKNTFVVSEKSVWNSNFSVHK